MLKSQFLTQVTLCLFLTGLLQTAHSQVDCDHLSLDYNVNQWYYALGIIPLVNIII